MKSVDQISAKQSRTNFSPEIGALLGGLVFCIVDSYRLWFSPIRSQLITTVCSVLIFSSALFSITTRLVLYLNAHCFKPLSWKRHLVGVSWALPIIIPICFQLFQGTGISRRWYAPYGPYISIVVLSCATVVGIHVFSLVGAMLHGKTWRFALLIPLLCCAAFLIWADHHFYPNQYAYLHSFLAFSCTLFFMLSSWLLFGYPIAPPYSRWIASGVLLLSIPAFFACAAFSLSTIRQKQTLAMHTQFTSRLVNAYRAILDFDGDKHSIIFGDHDCKNFNAKIHPYAVDVPGNNIDENCDGMDQQLSAIKPQLNKTTLDVSSYKTLLNNWKKRQEAISRLNQTARYNVILIVLDSLRADQMNISKKNLENHPHLINFLNQGRNFTNAFSTGAGTDIGMPTMLTGEIKPLDDKHLSLFGAYQKSGFITYAVLQREVELWVGRQFPLDGLMNRKIVINDPWRRNIGTQATSAAVTEHGIQFLSKHANERFFLWLHYFDIHEHHQIDPRFLSNPSHYRAKRGMPFYRSMIRLVDQHVNRLFLTLEELGLRDKTIIALISDHGEGLVEQPRLPFNHGDVLYNPLIHVPFCLRIPHVSPRQISIPISIADLYPTLLDLSQVSHPEPSYGISLIPYLLDYDFQETNLQRLVRPLIMFEAKQRGILMWPWKLLMWQDQELIELYHLEQDYAEQNNLADEKPRNVRYLVELLNGYHHLSINRLEVSHRHKSTIAVH